VTPLGYLLAVLIGLALGLLGGGGSILTIPVLVYVLGIGMKQAVPMSLVVVGITGAVGALRHWRAGHVRWATVLAFAPPAMLGALAGARVATLVSSRIQLQIFAVLMLAAAVSMYRGPAPWQRRAEQAPGRRSWPAVAALGAGIGALTGLVGVGGGFLYVPALALLGGLDMRAAVGTSLALIVVSCAAGFLGHLDAAALDWRLVTLFTGLAVAGVLAGSALCRYVAQERLRRGFAVFLVVMSIFVFLRPR
jgi:uncharacterized protein